MTEVLPDVMVVITAMNKHTKSTHCISYTIVTQRSYLNKKLTYILIDTQYQSPEKQRKSCEFWQPRG